MLKYESADLIIQEHSKDYLEDHISLITNPYIMYYVDLNINDRIKAIENFNEIRHDISNEKRTKFFFIIIEKNTKQFVGEIGYTLMPNDIGHVGYFTQNRFWNKGYTTQALMGLIEYAQSQNLKALETGCFSENVASERVMIKCGFQKEREYLITYDGVKKQRVEYILKLK